VIPGYNAANTIGPLVQQIKTLGFEAIVVDDGSIDRTAQIATDAGALVISHIRNQGKGRALRTGFAAALQAGYEVVITMDSDGQHDPREIPRLLEHAAVSEAPLVVGNRLVNNQTMPRTRRWTNRVMSLLTSWLARQHIPDSQCGFRVIHRQVLERVSLSSNRFEIETELLLGAARLGWSVASVPINTIYNRHPSHIHPLWDTMRFARFVLRYLFQTRMLSLREQDDPPSRARSGSVRLQDDV